MTYDILIDNSRVFGGTILGASLLLIILLVILTGIITYIWRKLRENEKLKYEFITIIAHKFRTPLGAVKWLIEEILADETDARKRESFTNIAKSNEKLISLTATLIELTDTTNESRASYAFEPLSLCDLVQGVSNAFKGQFLEKNLSFSVQCQAEDIRAKIDRVRMEFVLQTILENASIYTPPGRRVQVTVRRNGRKAIIEIADNGIGIDRADLPHIFAKFYRTEKAQSVDTEGFGVGLFLAQSIVKRHKGRIQVYSDGLDKGATFTITLPAVG